MTSTQIILVRHGETEWNRVKRIQGHLDIDLSQGGRGQARALAARMADEARQGLRIDALYSSDLARARQTAEPLAHVLQQVVTLEPALRERQYGVFQGHDAEQIREQFPADYLAWQSRDPQFAPPGGESQAAFYARVVEVLDALVQRHRAQRIVCVAHGGVLDCAYRYARGIALTLPRTQALLNASLNVLEFDAHGARVVRWADVAHLQDSSDDGAHDRVDPRVV
jgi:probable phosphoglycerate mutase